MQREKMTAEKAVTFNRYSLANAAIAIAERHCDCKPYVDIFTYVRWQALGYQVKKGEHGTKLGVLIEQETENEKGEKVLSKRPWGTVVFCRCQVEKKKGA